MSSDGCISIKDGEFWTFYTSEKDLPTDKLYSMAEAESGDIYITTSLGIVRYDGTKFMHDSVTFDISKGIFKHFPAEASFDVAVKGGDTVCYVSKDNSFNTYYNGMIKNRHRVFNNDKLTDSYLSRLTKFQDNIYFYASHRSRHIFRIMKYDGDTTEVVDFHKTNCPYHDSTGFSLYNYCIDSKGRIWASVAYHKTEKIDKLKVVVWGGENWYAPADPNGYSWIGPYRLVSIGSKVFILGENPANNEMIVYDDDIVSVEDHGISGSTCIYPNPAQTRATLSLTCEKDENCTIRAIDILGRGAVLWRGLLHAGRNDVPLDVSGLARGCHDLLIEGGSGSRSVKMVKE